MTTIPGVFFDARRPRAHPVQLSAADGRLLIQGDGIDLAVPIGAIRFSAPLGTTPRFLDFPDGATCEVADGSALDRALADEHIGAPHRIDAIERSWRWAAGAVVLLVAVAIPTYRFGLPAAAHAAAAHFPYRALDIMSEQTMDAMDASVFSETEISKEQQSALIGAFQNIVLPEDLRERATVVFRRSDTLGANAFALPSGAAIVTDRLVHLSYSDAEVMAVLAHEMGHVALRHGVRSMMQASAVSTVLAWYLGDLSAVAAMAPATVLNAHYSQGFEREADDFAVRCLRASNIPPSTLADILERIEADEPRDRDLLFGYLSTHPPTAERLQRLRTE